MPKLRVLIDECLDRRLASEIPDFYVKTVVQMGWSGLIPALLRVLSKPVAGRSVYIR